MTAVATTPMHTLDVLATPRDLSARIGAALLWVMVTLTSIDFVVNQDTQKFVANWQSFGRVLACIACGLYGLWYLPQTKEKLCQFPAAWVVIILCWATLTIPFSIAPAYSAANVFTMACSLLFVPALLHQLGCHRTLQSALNVLLFLVALNWFFYYCVPELGRTEFDMPDEETIYRFGNSAQHTGMQIAWIVGVLLALTLGGCRSWRTTVPILLVLGVTLFRTQSKTAMIATAAMGVVVFWYWFSPRQRLLFGLASVLGVTILWAAILADAVPWKLDLLAQSISRSGESEEIESFTGRTEVWQQAWEKFREAPWCGWGYGCSRFVIESQPGFEPYHAHNLLLNTAVCIGFPGAALVLACILHQIWQMLRGDGAVACIAATFVFVTGITEVVLLVKIPNVFSVMWLIALFWTQFGGPKYSGLAENCGDKK
jgi:O-antigen ligase